MTVLETLGKVVELQNALASRDEQIERLREALRKTSVWFTCASRGPGMVLQCGLCKAETKISGAWSYADARHTEGCLLREKEDSSGRTAPISVKASRGDRWLCRRCHLAIDGKTPWVECEGDARK